MQQLPEQSMSRRHFLAATIKTAVAGLLLCSPIPSWAAGKTKITKRSLAFYNTHTDEELQVTYARNNIYDPRALRKVNHLLRDHRTGDIHRIDPKLLDILYTVQCAYGDCGTFEVISGYRSPKSNAQLRRTSTGVAEHSMHLVGKAIDIRPTRMTTKTLREIALQLQRGGVGYYPKSDFVHLDTGRFRAW